jgi:hypothetical protein
MRERPDHTQGERNEQLNRRVARLDLSVAELAAVSARLLVAQYIPERGAGHGADAYEAVLNG